MDDLVKRLRAVNSAQAPYANGAVREWVHEAADRIEALSAELAALKARMAEARGLVDAAEISLPVWAIKDTWERDIVRDGERHRFGALNEAGAAAIVAALNLLVEEKNDA